MPKIIYLTRHAQPVIKNGKKQGLSKIGQSQAMELARKISLHDVSKNNAVLLYSPLLRCEETARIVRNFIQVRTEQASLRFQGIENFMGRDIDSKFSFYMKNHTLLGVENPQQYTQRFLDIVFSYDHQYIIVIGNEVNIKILLQVLDPRLYNERIKHTKCYRLTLKDDKSLEGIESL